jgi:DNA modification methylase
MYKLIHANCIDVLRSMPDKSVDCVVTDMPYGVGVDFGEYCDSVENLDTLIEIALPEMRRVARLTVITPGPSR